MMTTIGNLIGGGLISAKMAEIKKIQGTIEDELQLRQNSIYMYSPDGDEIESMDTRMMHEYEMFDALYRLICAVGDLERLDEQEAKNGER